MAVIGSLMIKRSGVLTLSIALNLFLAGAVAGLWLGGGGSAAEDTQLDYSLAEFVRDLPGETRQRIAAAIDDKSDDVALRIGALTRARAEVATSLGAEPHDPSRVRRALVSLRETTRDVQAVMHGIVSDITEGLSPGDRARLARSMFATVRRSGDEQRVLLYEVPLL